MTQGNNKDQGTLLLASTTTIKYGFSSGQQCSHATSSYSTLTSSWPIHQVWTKGIWSVYVYRTLTFCESYKHRRTWQVLSHSFMSYLNVTPIGHWETVVEKFDECVVESDAINHQRRPRTDNPFIHGHGLSSGSANAWFCWLNLFRN